MSAEFEGRAALVTGAGRGIGRAIALDLSAAGAKVAIVSRTTSELEEVAAAIAAEDGATAAVIDADLGDPDKIAEVARRAGDEIGPVEILVNNAAVVWPLGPSARIDPLEWEKAAEINLFGPVRLTRELLPDMIERGWGRIVNVSSGIAANPAGMIGGNAYATTKAALEAHTVNLAAELEGTGVSVNAFRPGTVDTAMQGWIREQDPSEIGAALHEYFRANYESGTLLAPERSASVLLDHLRAGGNAQIWDVPDGAPAGGRSNGQSARRTG